MINYPLRGRGNTFLFDGSGTTGSFLTDPNGAGVFYFTLKLLYGDFVAKIEPSDQNAVTPVVLPPLPPNIPVKATLYNDSGDVLVSTMLLIAKQDFMSGNSALGAIYTFTTATPLSTGDYFVRWETPEVVVNYGADKIKLMPMNGTSNTFSSEDLPSDKVGVAGIIDPALVDNATVNTGYVDMQAWEQVMFVFSVGATDITVDFLVRESTNTSDGGGQTLKSATQITAGGDNTQVVINVKASDLSEGYRYVRGRATVGDGTLGANVHVIALGLLPASGLASDNDIASVVQIVS